MQDAFLKMVDTHQGIIYKICRMYRDTKEDREDLFQEIVYQLWRSYPTFRNESMPSTWMYRIALNTAIAVFRKKKISIENSETIPERSHPTDEYELSENEIKMYEALKKLNDSEKAIVALFLEDYSYKEIAEIIGITENYVGVQINRIKNKLKIILT